MTLAPEAPVFDPPAAPRRPRPRLLGRTRAALAHDLEAPSTWPALDSVRGLAVVGVVLLARVPRSAAVSPTGAPFWRWPLGTLRLSVDMFFVLSGFLVIRSWHSIRGRSSGSRPALG